ncbi:methyl-accepting chemotaxis protein [Sneathiella chinensis]|uniref:Chemotaxis protein n=1 Tax=Sneathiella chinensis TaxID=349750 RepID=A0ABQ5U0L4_9PROT|nr:methyl-accepting chemotaxis protein [Sneathiella chinensis]GLQ05685.1 chemotaxis protein [Sneathiella chinensis]
MNGSSPSNRLMAPLIALLVSGIVFVGYELLQPTDTLLAAFVAVAFLLPAGAAFYFRGQRNALLESAQEDQGRQDQTGDTAAPQPLQADLTAEINRTREICEGIAKGNFELRISEIDNASPLSDIQWAINELVDRIDAFLREAEASMQHVAEQKYYRRILNNDMSGSFRRTAGIINECTSSFEQRTRNFENIIRSFETNIGSVSHSISESSRSLQDVATTLSSAAGNTATKAQNVNNAADSASASVQTVASSAEEMSASIQEIDRQIQNSLSNINSASEAAQSGNVKIRGLAEAAKSIGEVVKLIEDIANQTNLLALNATIEAARAGDAGKGFAVVANEVKNLASQTARATEDISKQIVEIQSATSEAVASMENIGTTVNDINNAVSAISGAMNEQNSATREIAQSVHTASNDTVTVSENIAIVRSSAEETSQTSESLLKEATTLQQQSRGLEDNVTAFLQDVRKVI